MPRSPMGKRSNASLVALAVGTIDTKAPVGKILTILRSLGQAECAKRRGLQLEIGIEIAVRGACQGDGGLVGRAGHIPDVIGGVGGRRNILGCLKDRGLRNGSSLVDVQVVAALVEFRSASIAETPFGEYTVAVIDRGFISGQGDGGRIGTGAAGETGTLQCALNISNA